MSGRRRLHSVDQSPHLPSLRQRDRLRELRAQRSWSGTELAGRAGISDWTVTALETGRYGACAPYVADALADALGVEVEELFRLPVGPPPSPVNTIAGVTVEQVTISEAVGMVVVRGWVDTA